MNNFNVLSIKKDLNRRFFLLLSSFLLLLIISFIFTSNTVSSKKFDSLLINTAGLQRMLIRQYVSDINKVIIGLATSNLEMALAQKKDADLTANRFDSTINAFLYGGDITVTSGWKEHKGIGYQMELTNAAVNIPPIEQELIRRHLKHAVDSWSELKRLARLSMKVESHTISKNEYLNALFNQTEQASMHMDHVVRLMQEESENKLQYLSYLLFIMLIVGSVLFVVLIFFVRKNIVNPLGESISTLQTTTHQLEIEKINALKANAIKTEFLSCMSHELRTPMNAILGFSQLLELDEDRMTKSQSNNVQEILLAGHHLMKLINDVLDLTKIESGNLEVILEEVNLDDAIKQSINLISPLAASRQIKIDNKIGGDECLVEADSMRLKQTLINILSNAVKYNHENGEIILERKIVNGNKIRICITDSGEGLTQADIEKLFTPFERLDKLSNIEGIGIGLVICKQLIELMSGSIGIESEVGKGSTFWIELKLVNHDK